MKILLLALMILIAIGCQTTGPKVDTSSSTTTTPSTPEIELGDKAWVSGEYEQATEYYAAWIGKYPEEANTYFQRGRAYNKLGKYSEALKDFEQASKLNPKDLRPRVYTCGIFFHLGKMKEVKSCLAIINHPSFAELGPYEQFLVYLMEAKFKIVHKNYEGVLPGLEKAIQLCELNPDVFKSQGSPFIKRLAIYERAKVYFHLGQHNENLVADMKAYIALTGQAGETVSAEDYKSLAMALFLAGRHSECKKILGNLTKEEREELGKAVDDVNFFTRD